MKRSWSIFLVSLFALVSCDRVDELLGKKKEAEPEETPSAEETIQTVGGAKAQLPVSTRYHNVTSAGFRKFIAHDDRIAVVKFYADW